MGMKTLLSFVTLVSSTLLLYGVQAQDSTYYDHSYHSKVPYEAPLVSEYSSQSSYVPVNEYIPLPGPKPYETGQEAEGSSYYTNDGQENKPATEYESYQSYKSSGGSLPLSYSVGSTYQSDEEYGGGGKALYVEEGHAEDYFSFITSFNEIITLAGAFQESLTNPMQQLVGDTTGKTGVAICKLSSSRLRFTRAVKKLLESFGHWAKLGTSLEESHCRQDSENSLDAFLQEADKVAVQLAAIDAIDIGEQPLIIFKQLENLLRKIKYEFTAGSGSHVSGDSYSHHSH